MESRKDFAAYFDAGYENALPCELLEEYYIIERLGAAGDCDTLLVKNKKTGKKMVAKCYFGDGICFESREAQLLSGIGSNSIPNYGKGYRNDKYKCILREYIEGVTLAEYVRENQLSEKAVIEISIKLVGIMKLLHESKPGIIHRDIKPENIIIGEDKSLVLIDFGISRVYKAGGTSDTVFCGTRNYAPPEQYGFRQTDARSDIYSFGIVLSWMLTGKEEPISEAKTKLERIAVKCSAFAPEQRYKNDTVLLKELNKTTEEYRVRSRRLKKYISAAALACAALLVCAGTYGHMQSQKEAYTFHESLIEEAVRLSLGKPGGIITREDLLEVKEIYIFTDQVYPSMEDYYVGQNKWYALDDRIHGNLEDLTDLKYMLNLQTLFIGGDKVSDLSPLRGLDKLEYLSLQDNEIHDISPLYNKTTLLEVSLLGNRLDNIEPVRTWSAIRTLNLNHTGNYDVDPLEDIKVLNGIDIGYGPEIADSLDGLNVTTLVVGGSNFTDLEFTKKISYIEKLYIREAGILDISVLEGRKDITCLKIQNCVIEDLSYLFTMPNLIQAEISLGQQEKMEELIKEYGDPSFEIVYAK